MTQEEMRAAAQAAAEALELIPLRSVSFYDRQRIRAIDKVGVVPFLRQNNRISFYLYKPSGERPDLGDPGFQIPKGTRETRETDGSWQRYDFRKHSAEKAEPLLVSALREGMEEAGLKPSNIARLWEWGIATFTSATKGHPKSMWLYLAEMKHSEDFSAPDAIHGNSAECGWFDLTTEKTQAKIRPDHLKILQEIQQKLSETANL